MWKSILEISKYVECCLTQSCVRFSPPFLPSPKSVSFLPLFSLPPSLLFSLPPSLLFSLPPSPLFSLPPSPLFSLPPSPLFSLPPSPLFSLPPSQQLVCHSQHTYFYSHSVLQSLSGSSGSSQLTQFRRWLGHEIHREALLR